MNPRWGAYAPWPFVGATALLLVLILLTPALISLGQPAPGILTQAELGVDQAPSATVLNFYVRPLGTTVRYSNISAGIDENASNINWTGSGPFNWTRLNFTRFSNASDVLLMGFSSSANPVAVNVTACYESGSGDELYYGEVVFFAVSSPTGGSRLYAATNTPGVTVPGSIAISDLPYWIPLSSTATTCQAP